MGMSASQMRFCSLTSRQSEIENKIQQLNFEKTALVSESASYNQQLLNLSVPTPPSLDDYSKTAYTFNLDGSSCTITGVALQDDGTYTIDSSYETTGTSGESESASTSYVYKNGSYYTSSGKELTLVDSTNPDAADKSSLSTIFGEDYASATYTDSNGDTQAQQYYKYTDSTDGKTTYATLSDLQQYAKTSTNKPRSHSIDVSQESSTTADDTAGMTDYSLEEDATVTASATITNASIKWSDTGKMENFTTEDGTKYDVSSSTSTDETSYNAAYQEYEYQKSQYDISVTDIDLNIGTIETKETQLELKLQKLEVQEDSISSKMASLKNKVSDDIDNAFETFA